MLAPSKFKYRMILVVLLCSFFSVNAQKVCNQTIGLTTSVIEGISYLPGDTVCLTGGLRSYLLFKNIKGTAAKPIVIVNKGGKSIIETDHQYGIKFSGCQHIKLIGTTTISEPYGIKINRVGNGSGITIDDLSTNVEIAYVEIANTSLGGIYAKTDPKCTFVATRDKFTMFNIHIHDCYLHDIKDEGMYIGSSKFTGQYLPECDTTVFPHFINGVRIYNNIVERTGWDGIQVSSAPLNCLIYNNIIRNDSYLETPNQMSGILIGGGSTCNCYNNQIFDGKGDGIDVFGKGTLKIYNNLIVRAGRAFQPTNLNALRHGIYIGSSPDGAAATVHLMHNTIISPKTTGIRFFNSNTSNNLIFNNIISNPGFFTTVGQNAYFNSELPLSVFSIRNNYFTETPESVRFTSLANNNYDLQPSSPAVNTGFYAGLNAVAFDIKNRPRPHNQGYDIGAFESQDPFAALPNIGSASLAIKLWPIPVSDHFILAIDSKTGQTAAFVVTSVIGKMMFETKNIQLNQGINKYQYNTSNWPSGVYIYNIRTENGNSSGRFIVTNQ